jgi:PST family polysaccharide transporter
MNEPDNLQRRTVSGLLWTGGSSVVKALLMIIVLGILARQLTPRDFGVVGAALVVVAFSEVFSRLGIGQTLVQRPELELRHTQTGFMAATAASIVMAGLLWVLSPLVADFFGIPGVEPVLRALTLLFPLRSMATVAESRMRRDLRFRWLANLDIITSGLVYGLVAIVGALVGMGVWALVVGHLAAASFKTSVLLVAHPPRLRPWPDRSSMKDLLQLGGGFTAGSIANYVAQQGDNVLVGRLLGAASLGVYGRAYQLMAMPANLLGGVLDIVLFPAMARVQDNRRALAAAYRRGVAAIALLAGPASATLAVLGFEIVHVVLGSQWSGAVAPLQILALGMVFRTSYKMSESISRATGAVYRRAWRQWIYAVLVLLGVSIGRRWDLAGVAWGVLGALTVNYFLMAHLSIKLAEMTWRDFWHAHVPALRLTAVAASIAVLLKTTLDQAGLSPLLILVSTGTAALAAIALALWRFPRVFLGEDGLLMIESLKSVMPHRESTEPPADSGDPVS